MAQRFCTEVKVFAVKETERKSAYLDFLSGVALGSRKCMAKIYHCGMC